jgi:hypothetical protein
MAVLRIQSIKVSDLSKAVAHRKNPGEATPYEEFIASDCFIDREEKDFLFYGLGENPDRIKLLLEIYQKEGDVRFFEAIESVMFTRKIRKNATIQEIVVAYDSEESAVVEEDPLKETFKDISDLLEAFKEVCGFRPFLTRYIHRDKETGRYHVHILFSLMNPITGRKARWNKKTYFTVVNKAAKRSTTLRIQPQKPRTIGKYPLWMSQKLVKLLGSKKLASLVTSICRKVEVPTELYYQLILNLQQSRDEEIFPENLKSEEEIIQKIIIPHLNLPEYSPILERIIDYQREVKEREILQKSKGRGSTPGR